MTIRRQFHGFLGDVFVAVLAALVAAAVVIVVLTSTACAHDMYAGLKLWRPGMPSPVDCCGGKDCAAYPYREAPGEPGYEAFVAGQWIPLPADKVVGEYATDNNLHLCCVGGSCDYHPGIRCVVLPGASS